MTMPESSSMDEALEMLKRDLTGDRSSIAAQSGIPFAILRYAPCDEYPLRRKLRLFANALKQDHHLSVGFVSLSRLVWKAIEETDGVEYLFKTEKIAGGVAKAEADITSRLIPEEPYALAYQVMQQLSLLKSVPDVVFLVRTGGIAPHIYRSSALLNEMHSLGLTIPTILCYPGSSVVGTDLRFYDLPSEEGLGAYNYRVKIYGAQ